MAWNWLPLAHPQRLPMTSCRILIAAQTIGITQGLTMTLGQQVERPDGHRLLASLLPAFGQVFGFFPKAARLGRRRTNTTPQNKNPFTQFFANKSLSMSCHGTNVRIETVGKMIQQHWTFDHLSETTR